VKRLLLVLAAAYGCSKAPRAAVEFGGLEKSVSQPTGIASQASAPILDSGGTLSEEGVLLTIPAGWYAQQGNEASARRWTLHHRDTRLIVEFWRYPRTAEVEPRPNGGCAWDFVDGGAYATLPNLGAASVGTCLPENASSETVQAWFVFVGDFQWHIEARFQSGSLIAARPALEAMLRTVALADD
jgi:hypothetical protein